MSENSLVTGRVFSKLFFSFVVVLFLGMVVLDFSLRQVLEQSLRTQTDESLASEARLVAAHISAAASPDALQKIARQPHYGRILVWNIFIFSPLHLTPHVAVKIYGRNRYFCDSVCTQVGW